MEFSPDIAPEHASSQFSRWESLLVLLAEHGRLSVSEAAKELSVSESTIRRDFDLMATRQLARRTHGGIVAASVAYGLPQRYAKNTQEIRQVADTAAELLFERFPNNPVVGINGGTTTTLVAEKIGSLSEIASVAAPLPDETRLTVVASALNIATNLILRPQVKIVCLGGVVRTQSYELTGPLATSTLDSLWLDCVMLGIVGLDSLAGATCGDPDESAVTSAMVEHSGQVIAVAASNKIGVRSFSRICGIRSVNTLVTDKNITAEQLAMLASAKVEVIAV